MVRRFLCLLSIAVLTACASDPATGGAAAEEAVVGVGDAGDAGNSCPSASSEASCLKQPGCAWGDRGRGLECFYIGKIDPQPGTGDPGGGGHIDETDVPIALWPVLEPGPLPQRFRALP